MLSTAFIYVKGINDNYFPVLSILDTGSEISAISYDAFNVLGLKGYNVNSLISGLNSSVFKVKKGLTTEISNKSGNFRKTINMLVVPKITDLTPSSPIDISNLHLPQNLEYANREFYKPQRVQILLGGDVFYELLLHGQIK